MKSKPKQGEPSSGRKENVIWMPIEEKRLWDLLAKEYKEDFENQILFGNYNPTKP